VRVLASLAALAAAAFVLGAGAGLFWKDPGLVVAQWTGGAQEVTWSEPGWPGVGEPAPSADEPAPADSFETAAAEPPRPAPEPPAAAPTPIAPVAAAAVPAREPAQVASTAVTPPVAAAPPPHGVAVQVGAFAERSSADQLIARLRSAGFQAYAVAGDAGAWRVRVGPFADRARAERAAARLKQEQQLPTWVLEENGSR
jgi:DedD protein